MFAVLACTVRSGIEKLREARLVVQCLHTLIRADSAVLTVAPRPTLCFGGTTRSSKKTQLFVLKTQGGFDQRTPPEVCLRCDMMARTHDRSAHTQARIRQGDGREGRVVEWLACFEACADCQSSNRKSQPGTPAFLARSTCRVGGGSRHGTHDNHVAAATLV